MGLRQSIEIYGNIVLCQMIAAFISFRFLIPQLLNKQRYLLLVFALIVLVLFLFGLYSVLRINYLEVRYIDYYKLVMPDYIQLGFIDRLLDFRVLLSKGIKYLTPTALILLITYYNNQQKFLQLNEQKKVAELQTLKNQLNPHFLFNTLNNLYTLALKQSSKTPEVISKLSDILDYMLYRCNEKFVSIHNEIELIENYIALEKMRYGKRVNVEFKKIVDREIKIAPLLFLTFVENAFKHGVSQELDVAELKIEMNNRNHEIIFNIRNTIPENIPLKEDDKKPIGLLNVEKQLELIYPNKYQLTIEHSRTNYRVELIIETL